MVIARLLRTVAWLVVVVIVAGILLVVLSANPHNVIVSDIHDAGQWLTSPFHNVFSVKGAKLHTAVNWGLAALVYLVVGYLLASLVARLTPGTRFGGVRPVV
jgi:hypothetical protein